MRPRFQKFINHSQILQCLLYGVKEVEVAPPPQNTDTALSKQAVTTSIITRLPTTSPSIRPQARTRDGGIFNDFDIVTSGLVMENTQ
jgi:hypothetical protein